MEASGFAGGDSLLIAVVLFTEGCSCRRPKVNRPVEVAVFRIRFQWCQCHDVVAQFEGDGDLDVYY